MRQNRRAEAGFTLLELLIALVIGSGLIYMLSETLTLIQHGVARSNEAADRTVVAQRTIGIVREAVSNLVPPGSDPTYGIVASATHFEFATLPVDAQAQRGTMRARLAVEASADGTFAVIFEQRDITPGAPAGNVPSRHLLLSGLRSASLRYLYRSDDGFGAAPVRPGQRPELLTLDWVEGDEARTVASLSVRPRLHAAADCVLDLQNGSCR